jgi:hypothetical protein
MGSSSRRHEFLGRGLHDIAILVEGRTPDGDDPFVRARARRSCVENIDLYVQLIARTHRVWPCEGFNTKTLGSTDNSRQDLIDEQTHGNRSRMPSARDELAELARRGSLLADMLRLGIELLRERNQTIFVDPNRAGAELLPDCEILIVVAHIHFGFPSRRRIDDLDSGDPFISLPPQCFAPVRDTDGRAMVPVR